MASITTSLCQDATSTRFPELWLIQVQPPLNVLRDLLFCTDFPSNSTFVGAIFRTLNKMCVMGCDKSAKYLENINVFY